MTEPEIVGFRSNFSKRVTHVQGHEVRYRNRNNSAAYCSISLKFCTKFDHFTADNLQMSKVSGSQVEVTEYM